MRRLQTRLWRSMASTSSRSKKPRSFFEAFILFNEQWQRDEEGLEERTHGQKESK